MDKEKLLKQRLLEWNLEEYHWYRYSEACLKANRLPNQDNSWELCCILHQAKYEKIIDIVFSMEFTSTLRTKDLAGSFIFNFRKESKNKKLPK